MSATTDHDRLKDLVPLVALGAATAQETAAVTAHAGSCAVCRSELDSLAVTASRIGASVPQVVPSPQLKSDLMAAVRAEPNVQASPAPARRTSRGRLRAAVTGALVAAIIALGVWNITLYDAAPGPAALSPVQVAPNVVVRAEVVTVNNRRIAVVNVSGLATPNPNEGYEVWAVPAVGAPRSQGFMRETSSSGYTATVDVSSGETIAVTREPRSNTLAPTSAKLLVIAT